MKRRSLFDVPFLAHEAADLLDAAVTEIMQGNESEASRLLQAANHQELREFALDCMLTQASRLRREVKRDAAFPRSKISTRMPSVSIQRAILERDAHCCRFCGVRVVALGVRAVLTRLYPASVPWPAKDREKHGAFLTLNATIDHVIPHSRDGSNELENLVTACWPCNFAREDLLLHEVGIADPFTFSVTSGAWDGLSRVLRIPKGL